MRDGDERAAACYSLNAPPIGHRGRRLRRIIAAVAARERSSRSPPLARAQLDNALTRAQTPSPTRASNPMTAPSTILTPRAALGCGGLVELALGGVGGPSLRMFTGSGIPRVELEAGYQHGAGGALDHLGSSAAEDDAREA